MADRCNYRPETDPSKANSVWEPSVEVKRKRELESEAAGDDWDDGAGLEAIGYATSHLLSNLNIGVRIYHEKIHRTILLANPPAGQWKRSGAVPRARHRKPCSAASSSDIASEDDYW